MKRLSQLTTRFDTKTWSSLAILPLLVALSLNLNGNFTPSQATQDSALQTSYAKLPLAFEPNTGQADLAVSYLVHHGQATTYFSGTNTVTSIGDGHITMSLDNASTPMYEGTNPLESKTNYFIGNDKSKWQSDIPNYQKILAKNVYPGIDLTYYGTNSTLEHDFIVSPNVDYKQIAFHFDGQENLSLDKDGNIVLKTGKEELHLNAPTTYQQTPNSKHTIPSHFELNDNTVTVALNTDYDHTLPLVIDPTLVYSTYLGGSGDDQGNGIALDANGNAYVVGQTTSTNFPTSSPFQAANAGGTDIFVSKLNATGSALVYSTYLGGSGEDTTSTIAVSSMGGNAYITGRTTSTNFPTSSPFQATNAGGVDVFVTELDAAGSALTYSTYLGGGADDESADISIDSSGNAYITGDTRSTNFPTSSPFQASSGDAGASFDAFITKLNSTGSALVYSTYLGGSVNDRGFAITIDVNNNAYVTGRTNSTNFPTSSPFQASNAGGNSDVFVIKINAAGSALTYSTYLGSTGNDQGFDIIVDTSGNAYVAGETSSTSFPTSAPFQASNGGGSFDAFITKLNATGSALTYSTYLGGNGSDYVLGIEVDASGNVYLTGLTGSTNFPVSMAYQSARGGSNDTFVTKLNAAGSALTYSTYLGGSGADVGTRLALGLNGDVYIVGRTASTNFPKSLPFQASNGGGANDVYVTVLTEHAVIVTGQVQPILTFTLSAATCDFGALSATQTKFCNHTITAGSNAPTGYVISYIPTTTLTSGAKSIDAMASQTTSTLGAEQFGLNLMANTAAGSFTATNFGADPSGGSGAAMTGYQTANTFKFTAAGANIAQTAAASLNTLYTVSYIANISALTEVGTYSNLITYNIVASY